MPSPRVLRLLEGRGGGWSWFHPNSPLCGPRHAAVFGFGIPPPGNKGAELILGKGSIFDWGDLGMFHRRGRVQVRH